MFLIQFTQFINLQNYFKYKNIKEINIKLSII